MKRNPFIKIAEEIKKRLFGKSDSVLYIHGAQSLPAPLSQEEEAELVLRIKDDRSAKVTLIEHNLRLVVYIAKKFENTGVGIEDLISIGTIGLIKGVNIFDGSKTLSWRHMLRGVLKMKY